MNALALSITVACWIWVLSFLIISDVKEFFQDIADSILGDKKGGLPFVAIGIPLLLAACSIVLLGRQHVPEGMIIRSVVALPHQIPARVQVLAHCTLKWFQSPKLDPNFNILAFALVLLPSIKYLASSLKRHWQEIDSTGPDAFDKTITETADSFGFVGILIMSVFLLIPTAKHSAFLNVMGWDAINAVRLHIWAGRLLIIVVMIHGALYMYRWKFIQEESIMRLIVPPAACWTLQKTDFTPTCQNIDCSCYEIFRNLTGVLASVAFITIGLTSVNSIRRKFFGFFYRIHIISAPLAFLMVIFHYKRGMPYLAGGIVYYLASNVPVWVEKYMIRMQGGTRILSVQHIASIDDRRACTVVTIDANDSALSRYRAGQYVRLTAPSIARAISHPFSINPIPGQPNQFCIIFRSSGKFTTQLARFLLDGSASRADKKRNGNRHNTIQPSLVIDGFYGLSSRTSQVLQHDVVVFVAGGVGITPFLTLLHKVYHSLSSGQGRSITKKVVLHWICREEGLVRFVRKTFFNPLLVHGNSAGFSMTLIVHLTGTTELSDDPESFEEKNELSMTGGKLSASVGGELHVTEDIDNADCHEAPISGVPFAPSKFASLSKRSYRSNLLPFISFAASSVSGLCIVWYFYKHVQEDHTISTRMFSPMLVVLLTFTIGIAANLKRYIYWFEVEEDFIAVPVTFTSVDKRDESFEMIEKLGNITEIDEPDNPPRADSSSVNALKIEVSKGRPNFERLFRCLDQGMRPGVFICGPESLMENVRETLGRTARCPPHCGRDRISLYEESFIL